MSENNISANGIIISPSTKDKQNAIGVASTNWSECPYVGKLAEMLATKLSDSKKIPFDEFSHDLMTPQKFTQIKEQLKDIQIELMGLIIHLIEMNLSYQKRMVVAINIEQFDELLGEIIAKSVEENNPDLLYIAYSILFR